MNRLAKCTRRIAEPPRHGLGDTLHEQIDVRPNSNTGNDPGAPTDASTSWPLRRLYLAAAAALALGVVCLTGPGAAAAADSAATAGQVEQLPLAKVFTFLFLMLGPFKIIGPFLKATRGADAASTQKMALLATLFASLALLVAALLGETILASYGIPLPILSLAAGIILFLVALQNTLQQFGPEHSDDETGPATKPSMKLAMTPLAFPAIVTPYGIATLVVFLALSTEWHNRLTIGAAVLGIMVLNLLTMLVARRMLPLLSVLLPILGAVLGVVQVALGLQIMHRSLVVLGVV